MSEHPNTAGETEHGKTIAGVEHGHAPEPAVVGLTAPWFVAASMLVVIGILLWNKVPSAIGRFLDNRIESIRTQLADAAKLRAEAEALRDEYQAKADEADAERRTMLDRARLEAQAIVDQAKANTAALIERRSRMAQDRIATAERQAIKAVRAHAAGAAAAAAARLIAEELGPEADKAMVDRTIAELGKA